MSPHMRRYYSYFSGQYLAGKTRHLSPGKILCFISHLILFTLFLQLLFWCWSVFWVCLFQFNQTFCRFRSNFVHTLSGVRYACLALHVLDLTPCLLSFILELVPARFPCVSFKMIVSGPRPGPVCCPAKRTLLRSVRRFSHLSQGMSPNRAYSTELFCQVLLRRFDAAVWCSASVGLMAFPSFVFIPETLVFFLSRLPCFRIFQ